MNKGYSFLTSLILLLVLALLPLAKAQRQGAPQTLDGYWLSSCHQGKISEMRIESFSSYLREAFYKDSTCQTLLFFIETTGQVSYPNLGPNLDSSLKLNLNSVDKNFVGIGLVDYTYEDIYLTALTDEMAYQFNHNQFCNITSWHPLGPQRITGRYCRFIEGARPIHIPDQRQQRFGIFQVSEPWLYFGQTNQLEDSSSPARRPKDLSTEPFGKRM